MENSTNPSGGSRMKKATAAAVLAGLPVAGILAYLETQKAVEKGNQDAVKGFQYDDSALKSVDPALIKWKTCGKYETNVPKAESLTVDASGGIWVGGEGMVRRIAGGSPVEIRIEGMARAIATDESGGVYVALTDHVEVYGIDGARKSVLPSLGAKAMLTSIAVSGNEIYVGDYGNKVVHRMDKTGKTINLIGKEDASKGYKGLLLPSPHMDVVVAKDGSVWIADTGRHQLENYTPAGNLERFWGKNGIGIEDFVGCCNPTDFWILPDGNFVTSEKGAGRVKVYTGDGKLESVVAASVDFPENVTGLEVAADLSGKIVVLARGTGLVKLFERM
jgi:DNA-binding beta-propeller fold protein YncE